MLAIPSPGREQEVGSHLTIIAGVSHGTNPSNNLRGASSLAKARIQNTSKDILAQPDCRSWISSVAFLQGLLMLLQTHEVLLPTGSAVSSLLPHYWPSLPSPYLSGGSWKSHSKFVFTPFTPFLTCSATPGREQLFSSSHTSSLAPLPTNRRATGALNTAHV